MIKLAKGRKKGRGKVSKIFKILPQYLVYTNEQKKITDTITRMEQKGGKKEKRYSYEEVTIPSRAYFEVSKNWGERKK